MGRHAVAKLMARMVRKGDLPTKICEACARPFAWRKKWARDWDQVRYCSDRCRSTKAPRGSGTAQAFRNEVSDQTKPDQ